MRITHRVSRWWSKGVPIWLFPLLVCVLALVVRCWYIGEHPSDLHMKGDMEFYEAEALHLQAGHSTAWDTFLPIGYPALLALIYTLAGGVRHDAVDMVHVCMSVATCVLAYAITLHLTRKTGMAAIVGVALALYPPLVLYTGFLLTETTFAFAVTLVVWLLLRAIDAPSTARIALCGVALGCGCIVRSNLIAALPLLFIWALLMRTRVPHASRILVRVCLAALPLVAVVVVRNSVLVGHPAGLSTNGGVNFFLSRAEYKGVLFPENTTLAGTTAYHNRIRYTDLWQAAAPPYEESYYYAEGARLVAEDPRRIVRGLENVQDGLGLGPLTEPAYWPSWMGYTDILNVCARLVTPLGLLPLLIAALLRLRKGTVTGSEPLGRGILLAFVLSEIVTMYLYLGDPRGRVPFDPLIIILAIVAWADAGRWLMNRIVTKRAQAA